MNKTRKNSKLPKHIQKVYAAYTTTDEYGRLGPLLKVCASREGALIEANGRGWYGGNGAVEEEFVVQVGKLYYLLKSTKPIEIDNSFEVKRDLRKQAASKLTPEERAAVGLE